jgi:RNA recognition motif-containing protein
MKNIYVGNLSYNATEDQLKNLFAEFGDVSSVRIIKDKFTGNSKGFAFVEMDSSDEAQDATSSLDGKEFGGRNLKVNEARPKEARPTVRRAPRRF